VEFDHSHISGGLSKIMTADNVIGILTSRQMKERGAYQVQFMKTRSSSGVGQKVDLEFNVDTLRITDPGDEGQEVQPSMREMKKSGTNDVLNSMKRTSTVNSTVDSDGVIHEDPTQGRNLPKLKTDEDKSPRIRGMLRQLDDLNPEKD